MSTRTEYDLKERLETNGWVVIRSAGSHSVDLIAIKPGTIENAWVPRIVLIEDKSTRKNSVSFGKKGELREQWEHHAALARKGLEVVYVVRFTRGARLDRTQVFPINGHKEPQSLRRGEGKLFDEWFC